MKDIAEVAFHFYMRQAESQPYSISHFNARRRSMGYAYATSLAGTVVTTGAILGTGAVASRSASAGHDDMKTL